MTQTCKDSCCLGDLADVRMFKALGDSNRVALLVFLAGKGEPVTVSEAAGCCDTDISVVSRHLSILRDAGILAAEKKGREVRYRVLYSTLAATLRRLADAIDTCCPTDHCCREE